MYAIAGERFAHDGRRAYGRSNDAQGRPAQAQRTLAEDRLRQGPGRQRMTAEEITRVVASLRDPMGVLAAPDPADKAQIYSQLGLALTYDPGSQTVRAESRSLPMYVRKCPRGRRHLKPNTCCQLSSHLAAPQRINAVEVVSRPERASSLESGGDVSLLDPA
jgi:hypothetical protein